MIEWRLLETIRVWLRNGYGYGGVKKVTDLTFMGLRRIHRLIVRQPVRFVNNFRILLRPFVGSTVKPTVESKSNMA